MLFNDACECLMAALGYAAATPSIADVLGADARHAVCTATQCFESDVDAFGLVAPPPTSSSLLSAFAAVATLALWFAARRSERPAK